ncbi:MAG: hypothetical protein ACFN4F_03450, partial [Porphyromonas endodontalis]
LRVPVFFAKPYCSTDKPHVELLNKLIRQYIPKGTSFKDIDDKQIRNIRMLLAAISSDDLHNQLD